MCAQCVSTLLTHGFHQAVAADKRVDQAKVELEAKVEETREQIVLKNKEIEEGPACFRKQVVQRNLGQGGSQFIYLQGR